MSIPNLSRSVRMLIDQTKQVINHPDFHEALKELDGKSEVKNGKLYYSLGENPGFVVVDPEGDAVYRVYEKGESLSNNSLCDPAMAQLVLEDLRALVTVINAYNTISDIGDLLLEALLESAETRKPLRSPKSQPLH